MAAEPPEVGASVSCTLAAGSGCLTVPGRVRWCSSAEIEPLRSFGVEFGPLSKNEQREVYELICGVERAESSPNLEAELPSTQTSAKPSAAAVELRLDSAPAPLRALAYKAEQGLRLELALPWFKPGAVLRLAPLEGEAAREGLEGRVVSCRVREDASTQGLGIELLVVPCEPARRRRYAIYETPSTVEPADADETVNEPAPVQLTAAESGPELVVPKTRVHGVLLGTLLTASLGVLMFALVRPQAHSPRITSSANAAIDDTPIPVRTLGPALVLPPALLAPERATPEPENPQRMEPQPQIAPPPEEVAAPANEPELAAASPMPATPTPAAASEPKQAPVEAPAPADNQPRVSVTGDITEVFLPVEGSVADLRIALWSAPLAVAVDLPQGRIALTQARYDMKAGGVSGLSVGKNHGMTQVRVLLHALVTRYSAQEAPGGLVIRLKLDLRPLP